jgi:squalene synthase HpnC
MTDDTLEQAYKTCLRQASAHYENFPTASRLLPARLRRATAAIYSFARRADDIADEGKASPVVRHQQLDEFSLYLQQIAAGKPAKDPTFIALADVIREYQIPVILFERLLTAFRMDVDKQRYANLNELLEYCHCSADPVGELVLRLHEQASDENIRLSDQICTALQLINFIQDIDEDLFIRNRIYMPQDEMAANNVSEEMLLTHIQNRDVEALATLQLNRARNMLLEGSRLIDNLKGRLRWIIRLTVISALQITRKLERRQNIYQRPVLKLPDWGLIALKSVYFRPARYHDKIRSSNQPT